MSIDSEQRSQASITEGDRALALFTDRYSFTRLLAERIHEPPSEKILFFHGAGGNGKSLLLKHLQRNICKRLTVAQWQQVRELPDAELAAQIEGLKADQHLDVPTVLLDFGLQPLNEVQPKDRFYGLLLLRKALGEAVAGNYRLRFARYDFACIWYLHSKGKSLDEIKAMFPLNEFMGLATTTLDAITENPIGALVKAGFDFGAEGWSKKLTLLSAKQSVDKETQQRIRGLDVDRELIDELPKLFAEDLNASMGQKSAAETKTLDRLVLLFDTHEAFWGRQRDLPKETYFLRDEWLRKLLRGLDLTSGIIVVVAGRDVPRWEEARLVRPGTEIPGGYVQEEEVGLLAAGDARAYLQKVGIAAGNLCEGLIRFASVNPQDGPDERKVHPLHLGLCADVVLAATEQGNPLAAGDFAEVPEFDDKGKLLIVRLLRYVSEGLGYAIHGLSACRAFDREIYFHLGKVLNFVADEPTFRQLVRFSFVWQAQRQGTAEAEEWYRVHDLMRRLDNAPEVRQAHKALAEYYQGLRSLEAIYHINRLSSSKGLILWMEAFTQSLASSSYERCGLLLDIRQELVIESDFELGLLSNEEGKYFTILTSYNVALKKFEEAVVAYSAVIEVEPKNARALNNRGNALKNMAGLQAMLLRPDLANQRYEAAVDSFNKALRYEPDSFTILNSRGLALTNWAEFQFKLSQTEEAKQNYEKAISSLNQAISNLLNRAISYPPEPEYIKALNNKGLALIGLAESQIVLALPAAEESYRQAVAVCEEALSYEQGYIKARINVGHALMGWADLHAMRGHHKNARAKYRKAVSTFDQVLSLSPDNVHALNSNVSVLLKLGSLQHEQFQDVKAAFESWDYALSLVRRSLVLAPNDISIHQLCEQLTQLLGNPD